MCDPGKVLHVGVDAVMIDTLKECLPYITDGDIAHLKAKLPTYLAECVGAEASCDPREWWSAHKDRVPHWIRWRD